LCLHGRWVKGTWIIRNSDSLNDLLLLLLLLDLIDPIVEDVLPGDYSEEEDPLLYKSEKTGRGPMPANWLEQYQTDNPPSSVMCAYKLIKVEFRYWGMQVGDVVLGLPVVFQLNSLSS